MAAGAMSRGTLVLAFSAGAVCFALGAVDLSVAPDGGVSFDGGGISVVAYRPGWSGTMRKGCDWKDLESPLRRFGVSDGSKKLFEGTASWTMKSDGTVEGSVSLACVAPVELQCIALAAEIPAAPGSGLGDGTSRDYELPVRDGRLLRLHFNAPVRYHAQDSRQWGGQWSVRFGPWQMRRAFAAGDRLEWRVSISSPDGISLKQTKPIAVVEGERWVRIDHRSDIVPGSALDFSDMRLQDAPAGKHGWLKAVGGHFEFEALPGMQQRFYGVNLCFSANYPSHEVADALAERLVRFGYNSVRVHHHDDEWFKSQTSRDRLDYLLARLFERGIYATTDLYVSRNISWRQIGVERDGSPDKQLYKSLIGCHDVAFEDWKSHAQAFLEHVNPYTGRAYKNEPAMPLVSLVNEGRLGMGWGRAGKGEDPRIIAAWRTFSGSDRPMPHPGKPGFDDFDDWLNARIFERCSRFVRSIGAKALLTNDNNGDRHGEGRGGTAEYDYVDNHFYVDHPRFLDRQWALPSECDNANPIRTGHPRIFNRGWAKGLSKPYTITEWNFSGPGRYRGLGGILTGARAARDGWDGLWRFAYSHSASGLEPRPRGRPGYFDCATDPLLQASDRASVCLYLRGDALEGGDDALATYKDAGSMAIITPQTCGGFSEGGTIDADVVKVRISGAPATVWASSLDGCPLNSSSRVLLTHLTDVQANGNRYLDESRRVLLAWGTGGALIERGEAKVALKLDRPDAYDAYELDLSGNRRRKLDASVRNGHLVLAVGTAGPDGGRIYYEIVRSQRKEAGHAE